jgi:hypothetical protein
MSGSSRRQFLAFALTASTAAAQKKAGKKKRPALAPVLGITTTSLGLKDPSVDKLIAALQPLKLRVVSLGAPHFDPWTGKGNRIAEMREIRAKLTAASILVRSVQVDIAPDRTEQEIARMLAMANALDVRYVTATAPVAMLNRLNSLAQKQGMLIALLNGGRSEIDSVNAFQNSIQSFGSLGIAVDAAALEARGGDPLELLNRNGGRVLEVRFHPAGARTTDALSAVRSRFPNIPILIDLPVPGDIEASIAYFRAAISQKNTKK